MNKMILTEECKKFIDKCEDYNIINKQKKRLIECCYKCNELEDELKNIYSIDKDKISIIWNFIINELGSNKIKDNIDSFLNQHETYFIRELLKNNGCLVKREFEKTFDSDYLCKSTADELEEEDERWKDRLTLVCKINIGSNKVLYLLNPKFYHEVFKDGI